MKRILALGMLALATTVLAQSATVRYQPAAGTTTRYAYSTVTRINVTRVDMGPRATAAQRNDFKARLEQVGSVSVNMLGNERVERVEADGTRRVRGQFEMTIASASMSADQVPSLGLLMSTLYRPSGTIEIAEVKIDRAKTQAALADAFEKNMANLKGIVRQTQMMGFYGKTLTQGQPVETLTDIPAPASVPGGAQAQYKMRAVYTLEGRTPQGGYHISSLVRYEPISIKSDAQGARYELTIRSTETRGEVTLLPDGRLERFSQPVDMTVNAKVEQGGETLTYTMQVALKSSAQMLR